MKKKSANRVNETSETGFAQAFFAGDIVELELAGKKLRGKVVMVDRGRDEDADNVYHVELETGGVKHFSEDQLTKDTDQVWRNNQDSYGSTPQI